MADDPAQQSGVAAAATQPAATEQIDWQALLAAEMAKPKATTKAHTFVRLYQDDSKPVELICDDGHTYIVKSLWAEVAKRPPEAEIKIPRSDEEQGRRMFNDQTCARLGTAMDAPVPIVALVEVPDELIKANPKNMGHLKPCIGHGSRRIPDVSGKVGDFQHSDKGDNRERYNRISVFYGWLAFGDMQFILGNQPPHTIYSHDHGHFFPGGPMWTPASLAAYGSAPTPVPQIVASLKLTFSELANSGQKLAAINVENVVQAIGAPPDDWKVSLADRIALASFIYDRQTRFTKTLLSPSPGVAQ